MRGEIEPMQGEIETNIKINIPAGYHGTPISARWGPDGGQMGDGGGVRWGIGVGTDRSKDQISRLGWGQMGEQMGARSRVRQEQRPDGG